MRVLKRFSLLLAFALIITLLVACGSNNENNEESQGNTDDKETITIKHELGETPLEKNPDRIIIFDFGSLDTLDKLGIDIIGLPKTIVPEYLSKYEADKYENVGSFKEPDFEKIHSLKPDLIIISGRQAELYEEFTKIAPTIYLGLDTTDYINSFKSNAKTIGEIFNKTSEVEKELAAIDEKIKNLQEKVEKIEGKALILLANEGKMSAYGPKSRFGLIHDVFGFNPVDESIEVSTHGQNISPEYILEKNPDYIFVIDRSAAVGGDTPAKETVENDLVKKTSAYENGNIFYLNPDIWYLSGGGLQSVAKMVEEIDASVE